MQIGPRVEEPTRELLEHVIRGDFGEFAATVEAIGEQRFLECLNLCIRVAGYIAIDVSGHTWPADADLREIAQRVTRLEGLRYKIGEPDVYDYLARAALGFEPLTSVFPDKEKVGTIPVLATAALLAAYRTGGKHWWEYLDVIEGAIEAAAPLPVEIVPAVLLLARRQWVLKTRSVEGEP